MSDRPTPRTDAAVFISRGMGIVLTLPKEAVMADFARQLERELAEVREQRDRLAQVIEAANVMISANALRNVLLAYDGLRGALAAVKDCPNVKAMASQPHNPRE